MLSLLFLVVTSSLLALTLTPGVRYLSFWLGVVDLPDSARKFHGSPIPRVGGIAIALSFGLSAALLMCTPLPGGQIMVGSAPLTGKFMPAAALIFLIGLVDDLVRLKPWHKLAGQIAAAVLAYWAGVRVLGLGGAELNAWLALPLTVLWLIGCSNAINLVDGLDGLAAGVSLITAVVMLCTAFFQHNVFLALAAAPLAGSLLGFLRYNAYPATIFLGDCGSLFIGFLLGCYSVLWSGKSHTRLGMVAPLIALSLPLADTGVAILRRFLRGEPIFKGDRGHIHHRLLDLGSVPQKAAFILYGVCGLAGVLSLCFGNRHLQVPALAFFVMAVCLGVRRLGYVEFDTFAHLLALGSFRKMVASTICLRECEARLVSAETPDEFWEAVLDFYPQLGLAQIRMRIAGQNYEDRLEDCDVSNSWRAIVPMAGGDFLEVTHQPQAMTGFVDLILRLLESRREIFAARAPESEPYFPLSRAAAAGA